MSISIVDVWLVAVVVCVYLDFVVFRILLPNIELLGEFLEFLSCQFGLGAGILKVQ